ncbi:MAG TPA: aminoglycoside phosphotransferase family protein [Planctomycetota bacterium]|nr:aminoglycoside phosphotransferase family protein [Planctomycetota bacterium]
MNRLPRVPPDVLAAFALEGDVVADEPFERGHIHDTFVSTTEVGGQRRRWLHQRLNEDVFSDVASVMHNVLVVTRHLRRKQGDGRTLRLVPTRTGEPYLRAPSGPWRTYEFVEGTETFDLCRGPDQAYAAAYAFGRFQADLADLDPRELRETIPDFCSTPHRLRQLDAVVAQDPVGRLAGVHAELAFVDRRRSFARLIEKEQRAGRLPVRIVHGDTKLNNVLFDRATGEAVCVVDLDTCMPAYSLYDFGDLVRFTAATCAEDSPDPAEAGTDLTLYRALVEGYRAATRDFLTPLEVTLMPLAARLVTFTIGVRFLTDHLEGDVYFKVARPGHNLDRARVQFAMVAAMEEMEREMRVA